MVKWSCEATATAYEHLICHNYAWLVRPQSEGKQADTQNEDVVSKFQDWMRKNYISCKEQLLGLLDHESRDVQVSVTWCHVIQPFTSV